MAAAAAHRIKLLDYASVLWHCLNPTTLQTYQAIENAYKGKSFFSKYILEHPENKLVEVRPLNPLGSLEFSVNTYDYIDILLGERAQQDPKFMPKVTLLDVRRIRPPIITDEFEVPELSPRHFELTKMKGLHSNKEIHTCHQLFKEIDDYMSKYTAPLPGKQPVALAKLAESYQQGNLNRVVRIALVRLQLSLPPLEKPSGLVVYPLLKCRPSNKSPTSSITLVPSASNSMSNFGSSERTDKTACEYYCRDAVVISPSKTYHYIPATYDHDVKAVYSLKPDTTAAKSADYKLKYGNNNTIDGLDPCKPVPANCRFGRKRRHHLAKMFGINQPKEIVHTITTDQQDGSERVLRLKEVIKAEIIQENINAEYEKVAARAALEEEAKLQLECAELEAEACAVESIGIENERKIKELTKLIQEAMNSEVPGLQEKFAGARKIPNYDFDTDELYFERPPNESVPV